MLNRNLSSITLSRHWLPCSVSLLTIGLLSACGGGSGGSGSSSSSNDPPVVNQSVGGIWSTQFTVTSGTDTGDTINGLAIATEQGDFVTISKNANNGCASVGFGQASVSGTSVSGTADWALVQYTTIAGVATNCVETDGSTSGTTELTGTVAQRATLTLTGTDTTSMGTVYPAVTSTWTYNSLYALTPSLSMIAGNYSDGSDTLTISATGAISEQDPTTGCVVNGQLTIPNSSYNAYSFSVNYANCTGANAVLNGTTATGLATYDNTVTPNEIDAGWHGTNTSAQAYIFIGIFPKQSLTSVDGGLGVYDSTNNITWVSDGNLFYDQAQASGNGAAFVDAIISNSGGSVTWSGGTYTLSASTDFNLSTGEMTYWGAQAWVKYLDTTNYGGSNKWALPTTVDTAASQSTNPAPSTSQMAELFYGRGQLGGVDNPSCEGSVCPGPNFLSTLNGSYALFHNIETSGANHAYWSGTEAATSPGEIWVFVPEDGSQGIDTAALQYWALPVAPGEVNP